MGHLPPARPIGQRDYYPPETGDWRYSPDDGALLDMGYNGPPPRHRVNPPPAELEYRDDSALPWIIAAPTLAFAGLWIAGCAIYALAPPLSPAWVGVVGFAAMVAADSLVNSRRVAVWKRARAMRRAARRRPPLLHPTREITTAELIEAIKRSDFQHDLIVTTPERLYCGLPPLAGRQYDRDGVANRPISAPPPPIPPTVQF
jgi:hypothetical protein